MRPVERTFDDDTYDFHDYALEKALDKKALLLVEDSEGRVFIAYTDDFGDVGQPEFRSRECGDYIIKVAAKKAGRVKRFALVYEAITPVDDTKGEFLIADEDYPGWERVHECFFVDFRYGLMEINRSKGGDELYMLQGQWGLSEDHPARYFLEILSEIAENITVGGAR